MFSYRITKYDPSKRNSSGAYLVDEWTSYSDIGKLFSGEKLVREEYIRIESSYVACLIDLLKKANCNTLYIREPEEYRHEAEVGESFDVDVYNKLLIDGGRVNVDEFESIIRLNLRDVAWCKLKGDNCELHFGDDFYVYFVCSSHIDVGVNEYENLYVEMFESPYFNNG